jgi:DNA-binding response OmpR family regulator
MSQNASEGRVTKNGRLLVVEDEWLIADEISHHLRKAGHEVVGPVPSVCQALSMINEDVDAALLDFSLNEEDSSPIAEELAARGIPFAFLTGYDPKDVFWCREYPRLQKPISTDALLRMAEALLQKRFSQMNS